MRGLEAASNRVREDYGATTGAFTPASLPGLVAWYDAQDAASFTYSSGSVVSQWADKSGAAHHLANADTASQPSRSTTALNGHPALVSALKALQYKGSNLVTGTTMSFAIIYKFNSGNRVISFNSSTGLDHEVLGGELGGPYPQWSRQPASDVYGPDTSGAPHIIYVVNDGATSTMYLDGAVTGSPAAQSSTFDIDQINLGVNMFTWDNADIIVGEVVVTSAAFTATDRTNLLTYLQDRWPAPSLWDYDFTDDPDGVPAGWTNTNAAEVGTAAVVSGMYRGAQTWWPARLRCDTQTMTATHRLITFEVVLEETGADVSFGLGGSNPNDDDHNHLGISGNGTWGCGYRAGFDGPSGNWTPIIGTPFIAEFEWNNGDTILRVNGTVIGTGHFNNPVSPTAAIYVVVPSISGTAGIRKTRVVALP
jgi:hypothetical protein